MTPSTLELENGLRKAAVLLTSLPTDTAAGLLSRLSPRQVEAISIEIARLGSISGEERNTVIQQFAAANPSDQAMQLGGLDKATDLVRFALGDRAESMIEHLRFSVEEAPFSFLKDVDSQNLFTFIVDEHPQTIAVIVSHLPAQKAAAILAGLSPERQISVIHRIATMEVTNPEIIQEVQAGLSRRMANLMGQSFDAAGGVAKAAEILNVTDRSTERTLMDGLAQEDAELVEDIRRRMFVFEDVGKLSDRDIQQILKNVESSQWAMALKGASDQLKQKVFGNMSKRAATVLMEEMDYLGPVRLSSVEEVQQQIVNVVRKLEEAGTLTLQAADADEFVA